MGLRAELEVSPPGVGFRPADVPLHGVCSDSLLAVDFSVVYHLQLCGDLVEVHPEKLAKAAEKRKEKKFESYFRYVTVQAGGFCPFVVETQGAGGGQARHLMQRLVCLWAEKRGCTKADAAAYCIGCISTAVLRGVGRQKEHGFPGEGVVTTDPLGSLCSF